MRDRRTVPWRLCLPRAAVTCRALSFVLFSLALSAAITAAEEPKAPPRRAEVGQSASPDATLLRRESAGKPWRAVRDKEALSSGDLLLTLSQGKIESKNGGVRLVLQADLNEASPYPIIESAVILRNNPKIDLDFTLNRDQSTVTIHVDAAVPMTITKVQGFEEAAIGVDSAVNADQQDIELAMALDVTGSMSGSKIADLRTAATDLVDILMPSGGTPNKVRIAIAPYSASVNAGVYAATVTHGASANGCVHERGGAQAFTDAAPGPSTWLGFTHGLYCPSAEVIPLTDDPDALKHTISRLSAGGSTAGHIGTAWADYLISPRWAGIWPASSAPVAYNDGKTLKAIVLMTDGEFNTWYVNANGDSGVQARKVCAEMKKNNVTVYTIGFMSPPEAQDLLKECASSENHFFNAENGNELRSAFIEIAQHLNNLRLTQ